MFRKKKSQSTLEYTLLLAGLILAILYGVSQGITPKARDQMDTAKQILDRSVNELVNATQ